MSRPVITRLVHLVSLVALLCMLAYCALKVPEFWKDQVTTFATIGGFFTVYGVLFSVIETLRARSAAEVAAKAATEASKRVASLHKVSDLSECQTCIQVALRDLDSSGQASSATLARILELYTAAFHVQYANAGSSERLLIASLRSHAAANDRPSKGQALVRHKDTLINMLTDVTAAASVELTEKSK